MMARGLPSLTPAAPGTRGGNHGAATRSPPPPRACLVHVPHAPRCRARHFRAACCPSLPQAFGPKLASQLAEGLVLPAAAAMEQQAFKSIETSPYYRAQGEVCEVGRGGACRTGDAHWTTVVRAAAVTCHAASAPPFGLSTPTRPHANAMPTWHGSAGY